MIFKIGMRNLWRNKRRSFLAALAIGIGLSSLMLFDGFWLGMMNNMVKSVTQTYLGHIQIHHINYETNKESEFFIKDYQIVLDKIQKIPGIKYFSTRVLSTGMVNSAYESSNIQLVGVRPDLEKDVSMFSKRIISGNFLSNSDEVVIGEKLRKRLQLEVGDRIVLTTSQIDTGELSQGLFRVGGIYKIGQKSLDEFMVVLKEDQLRKLLKIKKGVHEIVIKLNNVEDLTTLDKLVESKNLSIKTWKDLAPQVVAAINMYDISIMVMSTILLSLVSLGILNTMFMSLYERMFEFGVLRALGTRSYQILIMVMSEAFALAILAIIFGLLMGAVVGHLLATYGVDYLGIEFAEITFTEKIYFVFRWQQFVYFPMVIFIFTILISFYPGVHAVRITMAKALHKSL